MADNDSIVKQSSGAPNSGDILAELYENRFDGEERVSKQAIWQVLCKHFFQKYISPDDTVIDLGAGYCEFINNIDCRRPIAVDLNPDLRHFAAPYVELVFTPSTDLQGIEDNSANVVFASNFFEHLPTKDDFLQTLREAHRVLRPGGRLLILQPNIRVLGGQYWDFLDHHIPLTDRTLVEALTLLDFEVQEVRARFLPYTTKSSLPQHPLLVRLYLMVPFVHRFLGGQAWVVATRP